MRYRDPEMLRLPRKGDISSSHGSRVMRARGKIGRCPLPYAYLGGSRRGLLRPFKSHDRSRSHRDVDRNDHYPSRRAAARPCDAMHDELTDLAGAGCASFRWKSPTSLSSASAGGGRASCRVLVETSIGRQGLANALSVVSTSGESAPAALYAPSVIPSALPLLNGSTWTIMTF